MNRWTVCMGLGTFVALMFVAQAYKPDPVREVIVVRTAPADPVVTKPRVVVKPAPRPAVVEARRPRSIFDD